MAGPACLPAMYAKSSAWGDTRAKRSQSWQFQMPKAPHTRWFRLRVLLVCAPGEPSIHIGLALPASQANLGGSGQPTSVLILMAMVLQAPPLQVPSYHFHRLLRPGCAHKPGTAGLPVLSIRHAEGWFPPHFTFLLMKCETLLSGGTDDQLGLQQNLPPPQGCLFLHPLRSSPPRFHQWHAQVRSPP